MNSKKEKNIFNSKSKDIIIGILVLIVVIFSVFYLKDKILLYKQNKNQEIANEVISNVAINILQNTQNCQSYSITYDNLTRILIDVNCVNLYYNQGYSDAVTIIFNETSKCDLVPIYFNNKSKMIFDYACVQEILNNNELDLINN
jgi:hypothetical protein